MPSFPRSEPEIASLALLVAQGLGQAIADFPAPPIPPTDLQVKLDTYNTALAATVVAETVFRENHAAKDEALDDLVDAVKADLKYAEVVVRDQPEKLNQLGWSPRRDRATIGVPGEVRDIKVRSEGDTWLVLDWKPPVDGGIVSAYKIQRRKRDGGSWEDIATSVGNEQLLSNQPRGAEHDYRILAVNKTGVGQPSATVTVVL